VNLDDQLVLLATMRPRAPYLRATTAPPFSFGAPDPHGVVGESPAIWRLREALAFVARRAEHVLVTGPSGVGKELIARAVHDLSARAKKAFVSRNAATLPSGIIDAELFGNAKNYPNAGMPERAGLVGDAHGGTLFLDEIGELSTELSSHLLRLLDGGEY
jgi:transcriptional regulator with GAF, ATPase, and Fis domain